MALFSLNTTISASGLFHGFTDCHSHLLPGVDYGIRDIKDSLEVLARYESVGVREVWLTPHIMHDLPNKTSALRQVYASLKSSYGGPVRLVLCAEYMIDDLFAERLAAADLITMEGRRLMLETSIYNPPADFDAVLQKVKERGYIPLLVHPERYDYMDSGHYEALRQSGVQFLLDLPSLCGVYGEQVRMKAQQLLSAGMYEMCGTGLDRPSALDELCNCKLANKIIRQIPVR